MYSFFGLYIRWIDFSIHKCSFTVCCLWKMLLSFRSWFFQQWISVLETSFFKKMVVFQSRVTSSSSPLSVAVGILPPWTSGSSLACSFTTHPALYWGGRAATLQSYIDSMCLQANIPDTPTLREESSQTNFTLQYKLLASILSAVCSVIQQS